MLFCLFLFSTRLFVACLLLLFTKRGKNRTLYFSTCLYTIKKTLTMFLSSLLCFGISYFRLSVCLSSLFFFCLFVSFCVSHLNLPTYLPTCLSRNLVPLSVYVCVCPTSACMHVCLSVCLSVCLLATCSLFVSVQFVSHLCLCPRYCLSKLSVSYRCDSKTSYFLP